MTDRELAEEYVTKNANHILDINNAFVSSHEAFLAGLKVGKENAKKEIEEDFLKCYQGYPEEKVENDC